MYFAVRGGGHVDRGTIGKPCLTLLHDAAIPAVALRALEEQRRTIIKAVRLRTCPRGAVGVDRSGFLWQGPVRDFGDQYGQVPVFRQVTL